jgi:hypothetical protein
VDGEGVKRWRRKKTEDGNPQLQIEGGSGGGKKRKNERGWWGRLDLGMTSASPTDLFHLFFSSVRTDFFFSVYELCFYLSIIFY